MPLQVGTGSGSTPLPSAASTTGSYSGSDADWTSSGDGAYPSTGTPVAVGTALAVGTATSYSASDHVHTNAYLGTALVTGTAVAGYVLTATSASAATWSPAGTAVIPSSGQRYQLLGNSSVGTPTWVDSWFNVKAYGAVGDGTTDDGGAIGSAVAAADSVGGGTIYFPPGTYKITATLSMTGRNYRFQGAGDRYGPSVIYMATANTTALSFAPSSGTTPRDRTSIVSHLWVKGPGGASSGSGIYGANDLFAEEVMVSGFYHGVYLDTASYYSSLRHMTVTDCDHCAIHLDQCNNTTVDTCRITGDWGSAPAPFSALQYGVYIHSTGSYGLSHRIVNSSIEYFTGDGVYVDGSYSLAVTNTYFESQQSSSGHAHIRLVSATGTRVEGCTLQGHTSGFHAVYGITSSNVTIVGNTLGIDAATDLYASGTNSGWVVGVNYESPSMAHTLPTATRILDTTDVTPAAVGTASSAGTDQRLARADHVHTSSVIGGVTVSGTPSSGQIPVATSSSAAAWATVSSGLLLVADSHSTPIVFGDLILNEAEDDLLYSDS